MEVNSSNFFWMLPRILHEAQRARFVALDVEMSGISCSNHGRVNQKNPIQDSYSKIKEAASEFQVLQIGFTFFYYEETRSEYITRTFNCSVSPLFPQGPLAECLARHLDRKFCVSTRSYNFLQRNNFNLDHALCNGISYLSREEQRLAEQYCLSKDSEYEYIDPLKLDEESQRFYKYAKGQIAAFVAFHYQSGKEIIIKNPFGDKLNGLQLRLVRQIIYGEYPAYTVKRIPSGTHAGCMSVCLVDGNSRIENESRLRLNLEEARKLSGLQILLEALSGGSFAERVNREWVYYGNRPPVGAELRNKFNKTFNFKKCEASLKKSRPILVGHNLFQDLAFIYQTFFEPLPPKVDDFLNKIYTLFPCVVDTKFMYTLNRHMMEPDRTLQELHHYYAKLQLPGIHCDPRFSNTTVGAHNAGFDSFMTAVLYLKQTHFMFTTRAHLKAINVRYYIPKLPDDQSEKETAHSSSSITSWSEISAGSLLDQEETEALEGLQKWEVLTADESASRQAIFTAAAGNTTQQQTQLVDQEASDQLDVVPKLIETYQIEELDMIPLWTDAFWRTYGNKTSIAGVGHISFS
ncbi:CAF1-domain-containing protein [Jackrogersella minutella]|nr:CAF1-domain-containing protein [Jackrogersella minutella]